MKENPFTYTQKDCDIKKLKGRGISGGEAEGIVLLADPLSFLGGVDERGIIIDKKNRAYGKSVKNKILVFPHGIGSTVGSYVLYGLKKRGCAPAALINEKAETIVAVGAVISDIPMVDNIDIEKLFDGDCAKVNGKKGIVEIIVKIKDFHNQKNLKKKFSNNHL